jgi:hypothetical protein
MKTTTTPITTNWPIVPPDARLVTLDEMKEKLAVKSGSNLRKWIIKQGFAFVLARLGDGNQLTLCLTPEVYRAVLDRRRALGYPVR